MNRMAQAYAGMLLLYVPQQLGTHVDTHWHEAKKPVLSASCHFQLAAVAKLASSVTRCD